MYLLDEQLKKAIKATIGMSLNVFIVLCFCLFAIMIVPEKYANFVPKRLFFMINCSFIAIG